MQNEIRNEWKPEDSRCGKLIRGYGPIWHYCVALSNNMAISWEGAWFAIGHLKIHAAGPEFVKIRNGQYLTKEQILDNLLASVPAFHNTWNYWLGWNCEHWARLVTTGKSECYQIPKIFGMRWQGGAIARLQKFLQEHNQTERSSLSKPVKLQ